MNAKSDHQKIALVLSGGGIKAAAFHIGVCLALKSKGFDFAGGTEPEYRFRFANSSKKLITQYVGSSAGAFVCSILASGHSIEALVHAFEVGQGWGDKHFELDSAHCLKPIRYRDIFSVNGSSFLNLIPGLEVLRPSFLTSGLEAIVKNGFKMNGLFTTKGLERYLRRDVLFTNSFQDLGVELFVVATQLNHTRKVIFGKYNEPKKNAKSQYMNSATISQAVAASTALPPVFSPYHIENEDQKKIAYFDGEIRDTLSTHVATDHGADLVIASYSVQPYHYSKKIGSLDKYGVPVIVNQALYQVIQQKIDRHRQNEDTLYRIYDLISKESKACACSDQDKNSLLQKIEEIGQFRRSSKTVYIHPSPSDFDLFFADHFSLNPKKLEKIVSSGFKSAIHTLRRQGL